jgi:ABC-type dipeptide/oligopeptide/nickel transport system permease subunit
MRDPWGRRLDVFDVIGLVLAVAFFALTAVCLIAFVTVLLTLGDPPESYRFGTGFLKGIRVLGVVFFPLAALVTFFTGWALSGELLRRWWREIRSHRE